MHGEKNYPFQKQPSDMDIGLNDNTEDQEYNLTLINSLDSIFAQFDPDIIYYLGGIDILKSDRFGRLAVSLNGLKERDRIVIDYAGRYQKSLVLLLSGGYAPTLTETVEAHSNMFKIAMEVIASYY